MGTVSHVENGSLTYKATLYPPHEITACAESSTSGFFQAEHRGLPEVPRSARMEGGRVTSQFGQRLPKMTMLGSEGVLGFE